MHGWTRGARVWRIRRAVSRPSISGIRQSITTASSGCSPRAAWSELLISLFGFYAAGAIFLNSYFGRVIVPLGAPFGFIKKGKIK